MAGKIAVIFVTHTHNGWLVRVATLIEHLESQLDLNVRLIDATGTIFPSYGNPGWKNSLRKQFGENLQITKYRIRSRTQSQVRKECCQIAAKESVDSTLTTAFREPKHINYALLKKLYEKRLIKTFWENYDATYEFGLGVPNGTLFVIPNGRLCHERAIIEALRHAGQSNLAFYETGITPRHVFFGKAPPLNRQGTRSYLDVRPSKQSKIDANKWFSERATGSSESSHFSSRFKKRNTLGENYDLVLFTSSNDEYESSGEDWQSKIEQYQGLEKIWGAFLGDSKGKIAIRVHPNLSNKSFREFAKESNAIVELGQKIGADIFGPFSSQDSYHLIKNSRAVGVYISTVGLESIYMGKETWIAGLPFYVDEVARFSEEFEGLLITPSNHNFVAEDYVSRKFEADIAVPVDIWSSFGSSSQFVRIVGAVSSGFLNILLLARVRLHFYVNKLLLDKKNFRAPNENIDRS